MVILLKIKRRDLLSTRQHFYFGVTHWVNVGVQITFRNETCYGSETFTKIYFLFIFNLVLIRIRKPRYFDFSLLMTSLWKPSIGFCWGFFGLNCSQIAQERLNRLFAWLDHVINFRQTRKQFNFVKPSSKSILILGTPRIFSRISQK